jgi:hypothetical protein
MEKRDIRAITPIILNQSAVKLSPKRPYRIAKTTRTASWVPKPQKNRHDAAAATDDANTAILIGIRSVKCPRRALPGTDAADISRFQVGDVPFMIAIKPVPPGRDIFISFAKAVYQLPHITKREHILGIHNEGMKLPKPTSRTIDPPTSIGLEDRIFPCPLNRPAAPCRRPPPRV